MADERVAGALPHAVIPRATYRLQLHRGFTLDDAARWLPYLERLGISHVYCSPLMRSRPGSTHGYDVVAHDEIDPELGGPEAFERFVTGLKSHGMGLLLDLVPNHMGVLGADNAWWMDVLEHGESSDYARFFDIAWHPVDPELDGKVLVPVLGDPIGAVLARGELRLAFEPEAGSFALRYWDHRFPIGPRTAAPIVAAAAARVADPVLRAEVEHVATAFGHLPARGALGEAERHERLRDTPILKRRLAALVAAEPPVAHAIDAALDAFNRPDALAALHDEQAYRLAFWRVAADEINYRRFFDVNDLAALRQEDEAVFEATQGFALDLAARGLVDGLRIDHPDGLHDPAQYFRRLQEGYARRLGLALPEVAPDGRPPRPLYVVAEKIAAGHETIPEDWALHGTTGYRFANLANGVFVDTTARERFDRIWVQASGDRRDFEALAHEGKHAIMRSTLASELSVLATELLRIARSHIATRDFTFNTLRAALAEVAACMPVYRTYIVDEPSAQDRRFIDWAVARARRGAEAPDASVFDFVRDTLLTKAVDGAPPELQERVRRFAIRFQQFSAPVTAKGVEDTAFYRYSRLVALNEVGGEPGTFGITVRAFHAASADRAQRWPHTIIATSTHDNKRSEDVRCRLDVLSEMPAAWRFALRRWRRMPPLAGPGPVDELPLPSGNDLLILFQALLGTLPVGGLDDDTLPGYRERLERYVLKAAREAKQHTSWLRPDAEYEARLTGLVQRLLARVKPNPLLGELQALAERLAWFGALNSLALVALRCTAPGVPDLYQGNELFDLSLVDPDNRRPVDYGHRAALLGALAALPDGLALRARCDTPADPRLKLWVTWRLLQWRAARPAVSRDGDYQALALRGDRAEHALAYAREADGARVIVVVGRLFARLLGEPRWPASEDWADTALLLPEGAGARWRDLLSGRRHVAEGGAIPLAALLAHLPAAVLEIEDAGE